MTPKVTMCLTKGHFHGVYSRNSSHQELVATIQKPLGINSTHTHRELTTTRRTPACVLASPSLLFCVSQSPLTLNRIGSAVFSAL